MNIQRVMNINFKPFYILILLLSLYNISLSQETLNIHTSSNEKPVKEFKKYTIFSQKESSRAVWFEENDIVKTEIAPKEKTNNLILSGFDFHLRPIDHIKVLKLILEGYSTGNIKDSEIKLFAGNVEMSGNMANKNLKGRAWGTDSTGGKWIYYFDIDERFYDFISSDSFGVLISLKNNSLDTATAVLTSVYVNVEYFPQFVFCKDDLVTFFVDGLGAGYEYEWILPADATITSIIKNRDIINAIFTNDNYGIKEIAVKAKKGDKVLTGTKTVMYNDCRVSSIGGFVWLDNNCNEIFDTLDLKLDSIAVEITNKIDIEKISHSDSNGYFVFDSLISDFYVMDFNINTDNYYSLNGLQATSNKKFEKPEFHINPATKIDTLSYGFSEYAYIKGTIFEDLNANNIVESEDSNIIEGMSIFLKKDSVILRNIISNSDGKYEFDRLEYGDYSICIDPEDSFYLADTENSNCLDVELHCGKINKNIDLAVYKPGLVSGQLWIDDNENGKKDTSEEVIEGIYVFLNDNTGANIDSFVVDQTGKYRFEDIKPGAYIVKFELPSEYEFLEIASSGPDENYFTRNGNVVFSDTLFVKSGEKIENISCGFVYKTCSLGDYVWIDENKNGLQDEDEKGINGVKITLFDKEYNVVSTTESHRKSGKDGYYSFDSLKYGEYLIGVNVLESYKVTEKDAGNDSLDSDIDNLSFSSDIIELLPGEHYKDLDIGLNYYYSSIECNIWLDENNDGYMVLTEKRLEGIEVSLIDAAMDSLVQTVVSDSTGIALFTKIREGDYYLRVNNLSKKYKPTLYQGMEYEDANSDFKYIYGVLRTEKLKILSGCIYRSFNLGLLINYASIGGKVWGDTNENGIEDEDEKVLKNISVQLYSIENTGINPVDIAYTGENGNYRFDSLSPGRYYIKFLRDSLYVPGNIEGGTNSITEQYGEGTTADIDIDWGVWIDSLDGAFVTKKGEIAGFTWLDRNKNGTFDQNEELLEDIHFEIYNEEGELAGNVSSGPDGKYNFNNLNPGKYFIKIISVPDTLQIPENSGKISDITGANGNNTTDVFYLDTLQKINNVNFGFLLKNGHIGDRVWLDMNENGIQDEGENGLNGITILLYDKTGIAIQKTTTVASDSRDGRYEFDVEPGEYFLRFLIPYEYEPTLAQYGTDDSYDSDLTGEFGYGTSSSVYVGAGEHRYDIDAGMKDKTGSIGGRVWIDDDEDGILEIGEKGLDSIWVWIYNIKGKVLDSVMTDTKNGKEGYYVFDKLKKGTYYIVFDIPDRYSVVEAHLSDNQNIDSDITDAYGRGSTGNIDLYPGINITNIFAGFTDKKSAMIRGRVWLDKDRDGLMGEKEKGINDVEVRLYRVSGEKVKTVLTSRNNQNGLDGYYYFAGIDPGEYYVQFINKIGYLFTQSGVGVNDSLDSDVIFFKNGTTDTIKVKEGEVLENINAGFVPDNHSAIGDKVWEDINGNGIQDEGEPGINGVLIQLYKIDKGEIRSMLSRYDEETGEEGYYLFDNLISGEYYIKVNFPETYYLTTVKNTNNKDLDSDINDGKGPGTSDEFHLGVNERKHDIDIGLIRMGQVGNKVWLDENENGIQDDDEEGVKSVFISLYDENGNYVRTNISDEDGYYHFDFLSPGKYYIKVLGHSANSFTIANSGDDDTKDSDITNKFGEGASSLFQINSGQFNKDIDIGILPGSRINLITYPNPVNKKLQILFNTDDSQKVKIIISKIDGKKLKEIKLISNPGTNILNIDFENVLAGYYNVILEINGKQEQKKLFLKIK